MGKERLGRGVRATLLTVASGPSELHLLCLLTPSDPALEEKGSEARSGHPAAQNCKRQTDAFLFG